MIKVLKICVNAWCNDDAPWSHVFLMLCAAACLFFTISFVISSFVLLFFNK